MKYLPLLILAVLLVGLVVFNARNRQKQTLADQRMRREITVGTDVMTTSGLYGTVTAVHDDDTVTLMIAPGVEVRWTFAALRDAASLPDRYRRGGGPDAGPGRSGEPGDNAGPASPT